MVPGRQAALTAGRAAVGVQQAVSGVTLLRVVRPGPAVGVVLAQRLAVPRIVYSHQVNCEPLSP